MNKSEIQAEFFNQGTGRSRDSFQNWLKPICALLHEGADCVEVIPTQGDGGMDMVIPGQGVVYQVYGPDQRTTITDPMIAKKIAEDLPKAVNSLGTALLVWRLLINRRGTGLGKDAVTVNTALQATYPGMSISVWHLDRLWDELMLPAEKAQARLVKLAKILGLDDFTPDFGAEADKLLDEAQELANSGQHQAGFDKGKQALALVKPHALAEPMLRVLTFLIIVGVKLKLTDSVVRFGQEMEAWFPQVDNLKAQVNYYRAKVDLGHVTRDEKAERSAALQGLALSEKLDGDFAKIQYCRFCLSLIAIACRAKALDQAQHWIAAFTAMLDTYRGEYQDFLVLELVDVRIWRAVLAKDEAELANCLTMLEARGKESEIGQRFAEALDDHSGRLFQDKFDIASRQAAQGALNLAHKLRLKQSFIQRVTYNLACSKYECDDMDGAVATLNPLLILPPSAENDMLKGSAMQLLAIIKRETSRFEKSIDLAHGALALIPDAQQQILIKFNLAKSLSGVGKYRDAVEHFQEAWHLAQDQEKFPKEMLIDFVGCGGIAAAHIGWQEKCVWALARLAELEVHDAEHTAWYQVQIEAFIDLRQRIEAVGSMGQRTPKDIKKAAQQFVLFSDPAPAKPLSTICNTLAQANALVIAPVMTWWKDTMANPDAAAIDLDYWGRGCFAQILRNMRAFPCAFSVMLEVRTVPEIRTIAKLWGLYADFILLVWKGATVSGDVTTRLDAHWFGPWGKGYSLAFGDTFKQASGRRRCSATGYATRLPDDVICFMQTEARELVAAGKLLIAPASVIGCISPGWGPMEQGIAEAGNAIPGTRAKFDEIMGVGSLPYSPDLPFPALLEFADKYETDFLEIRKNLAARIAAYRQTGNESTDQRLQRDIQDLLKMAEAKQSTDKISKKERIAKEVIGFATSPFRNGLRLDAEPNAPKTFEPLLVLQTMGYGWKMGKLDANDNQPPYRVSKGETVGAWLCPPLPGTLIPMMRKIEEQK